MGFRKVIVLTLLLAAAPAEAAERPSLLLWWVDVKVPAALKRHIERALPERLAKSDAFRIMQPARSQKSALAKLARACRPVRAECATRATQVLDAELVLLVTVKRGKVGADVTLQLAGAGGTLLAKSKRAVTSRGLARELDALIAAVLPPPAPDPVAPPAEPALAEATAPAEPALAEAIAPSEPAVQTVPEAPAPAQPVAESLPEAGVPSDDALVAALPVEVEPEWQADEHPTSLEAQARLARHDGRIDEAKRLMRRAQS